MKTQRSLPLPATIGYFTAFVAVGLSASVLGPTLQGLAAQTGSPLGQISLVFTAVSLGYLIGSLGAGRLYDRVAGHPVVAGGLLVAAASFALIPSIPWLWLMVLAMLILGMATGSVDVGGNTLLVWIYGERVGPYMNSLHFFFGVGAFLSPIIIAQVLIWSGGIAWAYRLLAVLMLAILGPQSGCTSRFGGRVDGIHFPLESAAPSPDDAGRAVLPLCRRRGRLWRLDL
jgi:FHS family Na+ dependent glucose MFS transporter 1